MTPVAGFGEMASGGGADSMTPNYQGQKLLEAQARIAQLEAEVEARGHDLAYRTMQVGQLEAVVGRIRDRCQLDYNAAYDLRDDILDDLSYLEEQTP